MAPRKKKFYVVWVGKTHGVFSSWDDCEESVKGYSRPKFMSFRTSGEAEKAYREGPQRYWGNAPILHTIDEAEAPAAGKPLRGSLCVDAASNTVTKVMEYQGVWLDDRSLAFRQGPFPRATGNIGEFLAIVHALALLARKSRECAIYSDSRVAIGWVERMAVRSTSMQAGETGDEVNDLVERALRWLRANEYKNPVLKWETGAWGENPADFGRK